MDIFMTENPEAKCAICGKCASEIGKSTLGTLIPKHNMINQEDKNIEAIFIHLECLDFTAIDFSDSILIVQKIEEDKSGST